MAGRKRVKANAKAKTEPYKHIVVQLDSAIDRLTKAKDLLTSQGLVRIEDLPEQGVDLSGIGVDRVLRSGSKFPRLNKKKLSAASARGIVIGDAIGRTLKGTGDGGYGIVSGTKGTKGR